MTIFEILQSKQKWLSMGELTQLSGVEPHLLREELSLLIKNGSVHKVGAKRGTKYAISTLEKPEVQNIDIEQEILKILEEKKQTDRKTMCQILNVYDAKMRPFLLRMVDEKKVSTNGKARGQLFWLPKYDEVYAVEEEEKNQIEAPARESSKKVMDPFRPEEEKKVFDFESEYALVKEALPLLPKNKKFTIIELAFAIDNVLPSSFSSLQIMQNGVSKIIKSDQSELKHARLYDEEGWRLYYWVDTKEQ